MAKDTFWFKHDYNARNDEKILELRSIHGAEAYGVYWMIVETMADNDNGGIKGGLIGGLSHGFGVAKDRLQEIIQCCLDVDLIYEDDGYYFSRRMLRHKEERKFFSDKGKEGAAKKREKYRGALGGLKRGEEKRGEERRIDINTGVQGKVEKVNVKLHGVGEFEIDVFDKCERWQYDELKSFISGSQQNFESIAMTNRVIRVGDNFKTVLQAFVAMIQSTNEYQESNHLRKYFANWVAKKNGTLENYIEDIKKSNGVKKLSVNDYI
jgi:hypothetical protein